MDLGTKIKRAQFRLVPLFEKILLILSDHFFDFGPVFKCHTKDGKNSLDFQIQNFILNLLGKKSLKKPKYYRSSPGPENSCSGSKQPYNFF